VWGRGLRFSAVRTAAVAAVLLVALLAPPAAGASEWLGDLDVKDVTLAVNARGEALVGYTRTDGRHRDVLAWGAVNARFPNATRPQVRFRFDYSGGLRRYGVRIRPRFVDRCRRYDGPTLAFLVAACRAPDGSYWALQRWQRLLPMRGVEPWTARQSAYELHLSHWTGPMPQLEVSPNWTYGGQWQGLFGRLTYLGRPVHGFRTPSSRRRDPYARFVYIDTFNSVYGAGWRHDAGKVLHLRNGAFCYSFVPQRTPAGYPVRDVRGPGNGERHRVVVMGPGVTPVVSWEGPGLGGYDGSLDEGYNRLFDRIVGPDDRACRNER
jgi:hypothetical protein